MRAPHAPTAVCSSQYAHAMFAPRTIFLDLETTGLSPRTDGITEVGMVILEAGAAPREWSTLVRPPRAVPPEIVRLTGISNEMLRDAPVFGDIAAELMQLLDGALLVAHNARFDYAFLKHSFGRANLPFFTPVLCTARLARELDPHADSVSLDALIQRYRLPQDARHRALGDARMTYALAQAFAGEHAAGTIDAAVRRVLRRPSLPRHLPVDTLTQIPDGPGVYLFYGLNQHPLYIGKAVSLRDRVGQHFSGDWNSARGVRLADELRHIEWIETAGELSALLQEAELVRTRMPSHNVKLRRRTETVALKLDHAARSVLTVDATALAGAELPGLHGPFASARAARTLLAQLCDESALCRKTLGLEKRRRNEPAGTPCFAFQVKRCLGVCCGQEAEEAHWERFCVALADSAMPPWRSDGAIELVERDEVSGRTARFVVRDWCLVDASGQTQPFEYESFRILKPYIEGRKRNSRVEVNHLRDAPDRV